MAHPQDNSKKSFGKLIFTTPDTEMQKIINESVALAQEFPEIIVSIHRDRHQFAVSRKKEREEEKNYCNNSEDCLPDFDLPGSGEFTPQLCNSGRQPVMSDLTVLVFLVLRGWLGSLSDREAIERLRDSRTLEYWLASISARMPGRTALCDTLNIISNETRELIIDAQICRVEGLDLDDFKRITFDSTAVEASSCWPTDAKIIHSLLNKTYNSFTMLEKFGIDSFRPHWCPHWLKKLNSLSAGINMLAGKKNSGKKIKQKYKEQLRTAQKMLDWLSCRFYDLEVAVQTAELAPGLSRKLDMLWSQLDKFLADCAHVIYYTGQRVFDGIVLPSTEKILSISDRSAAYISKGSRNAVIGYRPQLARSGSGFIVSLVVEEGNNADSAMFQPTLDDIIRRTGTVPETLAVDDGYSSAPNYEYAISLGVKNACFNGAKGKRIIPQEVWESEEIRDARNWRSAAESTMFVMKYVYRLDRMRRRGIKAVRAEMLEKVIAHNIRRTVRLLEKRSASPPKEQNAA